jgi:hypothetical protein
MFSMRQELHFLNIIYTNFRLEWVKAPPSSVSHRA